MRRRGKRDANHQAIVEALRRVGCSVLDLGSVGDGCPDLLVGVACGRMLGSGALWQTRANILIEVKDGSLPPSRRQLTDDQKRWRAGWKGQVEDVKSVKEALELVGVRT